MWQRYLQIAGYIGQTCPSSWIHCHRVQLQSQCRRSMASSSLETSCGRGLCPSARLQVGLSLHVLQVWTMCHPATSEDKVQIRLSSDPSEWLVSDASFARVSCPNHGELAPFLSQKIHLNWQNCHLNSQRVGRKWKLVRCLPRCTYSAAPLPKVVEGEPTGPCPAVVVSFLARVPQLAATCSPDETDCG